MYTVYEYRRELAEAVKAGREQAGDQAGLTFLTGLRRIIAITGYNMFYDRFSMRESSKIRSIFSISFFLVTRGGHR